MLAPGERYKLLGPRVLLCLPSLPHGQFLLREQEAVEIFFFSCSSWKMLSPFLICLEKVVTLLSSRLLGLHLPADPVIFLRVPRNE